MDNDLLFTLITKEEWKIYSAMGFFETESLKSEGMIHCYYGNQVEEAANRLFPALESIILIVIDPLRIQEPIKYEKNEKEIFPKICGAFSIDAVIDKIELKKEGRSRFSVKVKHFD